MSVQETVNLVDQPVAGNFEFVPLGGDGWIAPQSAYIGDMKATGDATAGDVRMKVLRDDRFEHLIQFLAGSSGQNSAQDYRFAIARRLGLNIHQIGTTKASGVTDEVLNSILWTPPPMIAPVEWTLTMDNTDTIAYDFKFVVYNFNIRATEKVPLNVLLSSLTRAGSAI